MVATNISVVQSTWPVDRHTTWQLAGPLKGFEAINCYCFFGGEGAAEEGSVVRGLSPSPMWPSFSEALPGGGESHVARLNFKTSCVCVYKCLSLIVGFAITVTIWPRMVVSCCDFILRAVAAFWAMSLVRIYPGRASLVQTCSHIWWASESGYLSLTGFHLSSCRNQHLHKNFNVIWNT